MGKTRHPSARRPAAGKHPHACGEDTRSAIPPQMMEETPPRMWGRLARRLQRLNELGNTPTHVGKTQLLAARLAWRGKHPHACGEDWRKSDRTTILAETPPRMWGRPSLRNFRQLAPGNTPTHVGKTRMSKLLPIISRKHPHACGEDCVTRTMAGFSLETPPRMWGRPSLASNLPLPGGNTPTHVGKTPAYCV